jgi:hypothetical protein
VKLKALIAGVVVAAAIEFVGPAEPVGSACRNANDATQVDGSAAAACPHAE